MKQVENISLFRRNNSAGNPRISEKPYLPALFIAFCCIFPGCFSSQGQIKDETLFTPGFIGENRFQVIITARPDQSAKSLVDQRESAITRARNEVQKKTLDGLVQYRLEKHQFDASGAENLSSVTSPQAAQKLHDEYLSLLSFGEIAEEYYEKDNTAVIIFRIEKAGLKKIVESAGVEQIKKKPESQKGESK